MTPIYRTKHAEAMLHYGVWLSTLVFLFMGVFLATLNIIFTLINVAHNPVR